MRKRKEYSRARGDNRIAVRQAFSYDFSRAISPPDKLFPFARNMDNEEFPVKHFVSRVVFK
jgi:hypothetical protein